MLYRIHVLIGKLLLLLFVPCMVLAQGAPTGLSAELQPGGEVYLTWTEPETDLIEPFDGDEIAGFEYYPASAWQPSGGYLKGFPTYDWKSAWYSEQEFSDFLLESTLLNVSGATSRGLLFRTNGPRDYDMTGYCFYIAYAAQTFALYEYEAGSSSIITGWTQSDAINVGNGQTNTLTVAAQNDQISLFINGVAVAVLTNDGPESGYVGLVGASSNEVWFDDIQCIVSRSAVAELVESALADGAPIPGPIVPGPEEGPSGTERDRLDNRDPVPSEGMLDEVLGYRIYRDGLPVGLTADNEYVDQLPATGEYSYTVTAHHADMGESEPSDPVEVSWYRLAVDLSSDMDTVPATGGVLTYDAHLVSYLDTLVEDVSFWTRLRTPAGTVFGPLYHVVFDLQPHMDVAAENLTQTIPAFAPAGTYLFSGHAGLFPNWTAMDTLSFEKLPGATGDPLRISDLPGGGTWPVTGDAEAGDSGDAYLRPEQPRLLAPWPNPFNDTVNLKLSLPDQGGVTLQILDVLGRTVAVVHEGSLAAGDHRFELSADRWATGVYFAVATLPDGPTLHRKLLLLR